MAKLYGVATKIINQAVKNNADKFPLGYVLELTSSEKAEVVKNFDHLNGLKFSSQLPKAFTEKGLYMIATILKSEKAKKQQAPLSTSLKLLRDSKIFHVTSRNYQVLQMKRKNKM